MLVVATALYPLASTIGNCPRPMSSQNQDVRAMVHLQEYVGFVLLNRCDHGVLFVCT